MREMGVELHPRQRAAQQAGQRLLAHLKRLSPQVIAVKLQEIEGNEEDLRVVAAMPQLFKARHPTLVAAHRLASIRQLRTFSLFTARTMSGGGPVVPAPGQQPDANRQGIASCHPRLGLNTIRITAEAERDWQHRMQEPSADFKTRAVERAVKAGDAAARSSEHISKKRRAGSSPNTSQQALRWTLLARR